MKPPAREARAEFYACGEEDYFLAAGAAAAAAAAAGVSSTFAGGVIDAIVKLPA